MMASPARAPGGLEEMFDDVMRQSGFLPELEAQSGGEGWDEFTRTDPLEEEEETELIHLLRRVAANENARRKSTTEPNLSLIHI